MKIYSILLLLCIVIFSKAYAGQDTCDGLNEQDCRRNSNCQTLPFISCCGEQKFFCVPSVGCKEEISCGIDQSGKIFEFWSSCKPHNGFTQMPVPNATCESLQCEKIGQSCEWVNSSPCYGTACCPRIPRCSGGSTSTSGTVTSGTVTSGTSTTSGSPCYGYQCPLGKFCVVQNGNPACIDANGPTTSSSTSGGGACSNYRCSDGLHCILQNGVATCVPSTSSTSGGGACSNYRCSDGLHCVLQNGVATCVPNTSSSSGGGACSNYRCSDGLHCILQNGVATCVPNTSSSSGSSTTGNSCSGYNCQPGTHCILDNGRPVCIKNNGGGEDPCRFVQCRPGQRCIINNGYPACKDDHPRPPPHTSTGGGDLCSLVQCAEHEYCSMELGRPVCRLASCSNVVCGDGQKCILNNGKPTCIVIDPSTTTGGSGLCSLVLCQKGHICKEIHGRPVCVPKPNPCKKHHCKDGLICLEDNWGRPQCVKPSCRNFDCPPNYKCFMDQGYPNCKPLGTGITGVVTGSHLDCEMIHDSAMCMSQSHCALQSLRSCCGNILQVCVNRPSMGCQPDFSKHCAINPKDNQIYHLDNTCKPSKGFIPYTPPASNETCASLNCGARGLACISVKSSTCLSEPCCPAVAVCVPYNIGPQTTIASTVATTASTTATTLASMHTTTATTTASTTSHPTTRFPTITSGFPTVTGHITSGGGIPDACIGVHCPDGEVCCQPDPKLNPKCVPKCDLLNCKPGYNCILNNGIPTCVLTHNPTGSFSWFNPSTWKIYG